MHYPSFDYPEAEELVLMKNNNFRIKDVFSEMRERQGGVSSLSLFKSIYYMLRVVFSILIPFSIFNSHHKEEIKIQSQDLALLKEQLNNSDNNKKTS